MSRCDALCPAVAQVKTAKGGTLAVLAVLAVLTKQGSIEFPVRALSNG